MLKVTQTEIDKEQELMLNSLHYKELASIFTNLQNMLDDEDLTKSTLIKMYTQHKKVIEMSEALLVGIENKMEIEEEDEIDV